MCPTNSMVTQAELEAAIRREIGGVTTLLVSDVSGGCGQAYDVLIVSDVFNGLTTLKRHRLVNDRLRNEIAHMHAFSQKTYTNEQFNALKAAHVSRPAPKVTEEESSAPGIVPELMLTPDNVLPAADDARAISPQQSSNQARSGMSNTSSISRLHHTRVADVEFWQGLQRFLEKEFCSDSMEQDNDPSSHDSGSHEVHRVFEDFFLTQKNFLSASDVARIRDATGMIGMAGM